MSTFIEQLKERAKKDIKLSFLQRAKKSEL